MMMIKAAFSAVASILASVSVGSAATPLDVAYRTVPCSFPNGWNAGDASRADRGIPNGIHHRCIVDRHGIVRDSHGHTTT